MTAFETIGALLALHALADFPLQGDWLSKAKNHKLALVPGETIWPGALACHAAIHAAAVYVVTQSSWLAIAEFVMHAAIDFAKCDGRVNYNQDQIAHIACKFAWAAIWFCGLTT